MGNLIFGSVLLAASLSSVITFYKTYRRRKESGSAVWLLLLTVSTFLWSVTYALFFLLPEGSAALFFYEVRYGFVMLSGWSVYLFIYRTLNHRMFSRHTLALLLLLPVSNFIVLFTNNSTRLFITYHGFVEIKDFNIPLTSYGPWFLFHCVFSYFPMFLGMLIIIRQFVRLPAKDRALIGCILTGLIMVTILTLATVFSMMPYPVDMAPVVIEATLAVFYYTLFHSKSMDMMFISRDIIFENTNSVLLVLDTGGTIMDYNKQAGQVAERLRIDRIIGMPAAAFLEKWEGAYPCHIFKEDPTIFTLVENEADNHYQVQTYDMLGKKGNYLGSCMEIKNVTPIMSLIHMLQDAAYYDSLTGLPNRRLFLEEMTRLDKPGSLPLCVMVGDVNGLKRVNDTFGHVKGDELLQSISAIILECAPRNAFFARTGGDEFVGLIPNATEESVNLFMSETERRCALVRNPGFEPASISLGYKIKTSPGEDIFELMKAADYEMYVTKRDRRSPANSKTGGENNV